jgi:hypothetical protein
MMDVHQIRHGNVRRLVRQLETEAGKTGDRAGGLTMLASRLGKSSAQVAHFASEKPTKKLGDQIAREIEEAFGLEHGWMDWHHPDHEEPATGRHSHSARLDQDIVRGVARAMQDVFKALKYECSASDAVDIFAELYDRVGASGITTADVVWLTQRAEQGRTNAGRSNLSNG